MGRGRAKRHHHIGQGDYTGDRGGPVEGVLMVMFDTAQEMTADGRAGGVYGGLA